MAHKSQDDDKKQRPEVKKPSAQEHEKHVRDYWKPERLEKASRNPKPLLKKKPRIRRPPAVDDEETEPTQQAEQTLAKQVANPNAVPYQACGKLFFTWDNQDWYGSASVVDAHVILTAGHNVYEGGQLSTNIIFYPAYKNGDNTSPSFVPDKVMPSSDWEKYETDQYDYAMCHVAADMQQAGFAPLTLDYTPPTSSSQWDSLGYPAKSPFDGKNMFQAQGTYTSDGETGVMGMTNNDMTGGASGGPWLIVQNGSPTNRVNGLNSAGTDDEMFSPIFDQSVQELFNQCKS